MKPVVPVLLALLPGLVAAAEAPGPADLADLLREAETRNPDVQTAAARLEAARRVPSQVQAPPDPEVSVSYLNDGVSRFTLGQSEFSYLSFTWTQEIPYRGKLARSGEVAGFASEKAGKDLERARLEVVAAVKTAYADLYRFDRADTVLQESRTVLETLVQAARRRYEIGEGIQESVLKAQTEILRLEAEMARVSQDRRAAQIRLNAAVGRLDDIPLGPARMLPDVVLPADPEPLADAAVATSPEVGGLEAGVRSEEAGVRLAKLNLRPDFIWSASYQNRDGLDPMVMGMFGVRLPIYRQRKQAQALSQKESDLLVARHELESARVRTRATVRDLVSRAQRADRLSTLVGQGVIPQARITLESAQASYAVGRIAFLDVLNDLTALLGARIELATQEAERFQALAALEPLLAQELIHVPDGSADGGGHHADEP
jgi:cobalt-zinc-cadmium efflux system outer membrane protein